MTGPSGSGDPVGGLDVRAVAPDPGSPTPPFEQVRARIARLVADGTLGAGTRLPTVRALAADLGLAVNTAARVYRELESDGVVRTAGRRGTFVAGGEVERHAEVAGRARAVAGDYVGAARRLGLTLGEALRTVEELWAAGQPGRAADQDR